jgi:uncharacterized oxidoreductase
MKMTGNTILLTGGGSGIGRSLAAAFQLNGNHVIIAGRRKAHLHDTVAENPGMSAEMLDITDETSIEPFVTMLTKKYPKLNVVIHNAGIMKLENIGVGDVPVAEATIATNLLGPIRLNSALLPHLIKQPTGAIIMVTSGLAFLPRFSHPTYCATKAAIHSYTQSLRYQLKDSNLQVIELIPPYVQTTLTGPQQAADPAALPLDAFIQEVLGIMEQNPDVNEVCVERVMPQRTAEASGNYDDLYVAFNERFKQQAQPLK